MEFYRVFLLSIIFLFNIDEFCQSKKVWRSKCPELTVKNSRQIRLRAKGRLAKIRCSIGYSMIEGDRRLTCVNNKWNGRIPICIRSGCDKQNFANGLILELYGGALLHFECNIGYQLEGANAVYCDGKFWNTTFPRCDIPPEDPSHRSCHFEHKDLCSWTQDKINDDFEWIWGAAFDNGFPGSLGAKTDHTFNTTMGHYIYIDPRENWEEGRSARVFSPFIKVPDDATTCIAFWFYFNQIRASSGRLSVYLLSHNGVPFEMAPANYIIEEVSNDKWNVHFMQLPYDLEDWFQVVLEAKSSTSNVMANIAIDDFSVISGDQCIADIVMSLIHVRKTSEAPQEITTEEMVTDYTIDESTITAHETVTGGEIQTTIPIRTTLPIDTTLPIHTTIPDIKSTSRTPVTTVTNITATTSTVASLTTEPARRTVIFETSTNGKIFFPTIKEISNRPTIVIPPIFTTLKRHTLTPERTTSTKSTTRSTTTTQLTLPNIFTTTKKTTKAPTTSTKQVVTTTRTTSTSSSSTSTISSSTTSSTRIVLTTNSTSPSAIGVTSEQKSSGVTIYILITSLGLMFVGGIIGFVWHKKNSFRTPFIADDSDTRALNEDLPDDDQSYDQRDRRSSFGMSYRELEDRFPQENDGTPV